jgi:hypothetical protein
MRRLLLVTVLLSHAVSSAYAQGLRAVQPLPGYMCMMLSAPPADTIEQIPQIPVRGSPSAAAPVTGFSPSVVLVQSPLQVTSGFLHAVFADKHIGWIAAADLKPWSTPYKQNQRCYPSMMSNGTYGYAFH